MGMTYGAKMTSRSAELVQMADEVIMAWSKVAVPGAYLVSFPPSAPNHKLTNIAIPGRCSTFQ